MIQICTDVEIILDGNAGAAACGQQDVITSA